MRPAAPKDALPYRPGLMDRARMAAYCCISESSLDRLRKMGLPSVTLPGSSIVLFEPDRVVAWILEHGTDAQDESLQDAKAAADARFGN